MRWRARALPSTTGLTISRCEGLAARRTSTFGAGGGGEDGLVAEVILHVAVAGDGVGDVVLGELLEERVEGLAQDAAEDVEAAAVGHAHHNLLNAGFGAVVDDGIERRDGGLAALE
jgi:hypothetical protein